MQQTTIAAAVVCRGIGLHSGAQVEVTLRPAAADTGIRFRRVDLEGRAQGDEILAAPAAVHSTQRATTLARDAEARISTVEHLLATLYMLGIHNVRVEVSGPEIPVMDGSARPLLEWVRRAGRVSLTTARREIELVETHEIRTADRSIRISPPRSGGGLGIDYAIDFPHPRIGRQALMLPHLDESVFEREVAGARTFGFLGEVEALRAAGLGKGGSVENTIILDRSTVLNPEPLRWVDEFVRHKVLDLVGDLALFGATIHADVQVEKGGHALHHALVCALIDHPDLWKERVAV